MNRSNSLLTAKNNAVSIALGQWNYFPGFQVIEMTFTIIHLVGNYCSWKQLLRTVAININACFAGLFFKIKWKVSPLPGDLICLALFLYSRTDLVLRHVADFLLHHIFVRTHISNTEVVCFDKLAIKKCLNLGEKLGHSKRDACSGSSKSTTESAGPIIKIARSVSVNLWRYSSKSFSPPRIVLAPP